MKKAKAPAKSQPMSFRVTDEFKMALSAAAAKEQRSQSNMLQVMVLDYAKRILGEVPGSAKTIAKTKAKKR